MKELLLQKAQGIGVEIVQMEAVELDRSELKPPERDAAARILGNNPYIRVSFPQ